MILFSPALRRLVPDQFVVVLLRLLDTLVSGHGVDSDEGLVEALLELAHDVGVLPHGGDGCGCVGLSLGTLHLLHDDRLGWSWGGGDGARHVHAPQCADGVRPLRIVQRVDHRSGDG